MSRLADIRQRTWDFALTIATIVLLGGLGVQSLCGMLYTWWSIRTVPEWEGSAAYGTYVSVMNMIATPLVVALVVVMGLCVPKRLFERRLLVGVSAAMVVAGVAVGLVTRSLSLGLALYLILASFIQLAVVVLTVAGAQDLNFLTQGRLTALGSGLLHLGFVLFGLVVVALQESPAMLPVFWASTALVVGGTALSFFADEIAPLAPPAAASEASTPDESCS